MMKRLGLVLTVLTALALGGHLLAAESPWETIEWGRMNEVQKFKWAVDLYQMGRPADASEVLKRVVAAAPEPRVVAEMREMLPSAVWNALAADAKTTDAMQSWIKLYEASVQKLRVDDAYTSEWAEKLTSGDGTAVDEAMSRLEQVQEFGAAAVCRMMAGSQKSEHRAVGRGMLLRLNRAATLPVIEYLSTKDQSLRIALLNVLGTLKDARAQAAIVRIVKNPDTGDEVRKAANDALSLIAAQPRSPLPLSNQAPVNYWWLADACLHEKPFTLCTMAGDELPVWSWSAEKNALASRMVPRNLYNEELAKDACYDGLETDKNDTSLRAMLIATYYSVKLELLGAENPEVDRALDMAILVGGKRALQQCLDKAVMDGDRGIAIQAADALGKACAGQGFSADENVKATNPLLLALDQEDRALRFAAARAIVSCQPTAQGGKFDNLQAVIPALSWGLMYESPARTVLIVHPDTGLVNYYAATLKKLGYDVAEAGDVAGAMPRAGALPTPDAVLISADFAGDINGLKGIVGGNHVPFVLLVGADKEEAAMKQAGPCVAGKLVDQASEENVRTLLGHVMDASEKKLVKDLIPKISQRAAEALADVIPAASPLPICSAAPALRRVLSSRDDAVRVAALKALGHIAAPDSSLDVLAVAADKNSDKTVRLAALDALAEILRAQDQVPPDVFKDLVPVTSDADAQVSLSAARAVSVAKFDPAQFTDLMVLKKVQEIKSGARPE